MISRLAGAMIRAKLTNIRQSAGGIGAIIFAVALLFLATAFGFLALFLFLQEVMAPWLAALSVGAALVVLGAAIWLFGRARLRNGVSRALRLDEETQGAMSAMGLTPQSGTPNKSALPLALAAVVLAGVILGRKLSK